nr:MAG TPA: tail completion protein [Caudoviricetes sp.]
MIICKRCVMCVGWADCGKSHPFRSSVHVLYCNWEVSIMSRPREELQQILENLMSEAYEALPDDVRNITPNFSGHVYFQAPSRIEYPAIVYERTSADTQFADDAPYIYEKRYQVTVIEKDPDSSIPDRVAMLPKCLFDRHYVTENLHHDSFVIYF